MRTIGLMNDQSSLVPSRSIWARPAIPAILLLVWLPLLVVFSLIPFSLPAAVLSFAPCIFVMHLIYVYTLIGLQSMNSKKIMAAIVALSLSAFPVMGTLLVASGIYYIDSGDGGGIVLACMMLVFSAYIAAIAFLLRRWQRVKGAYSTPVVSAGAYVGQSRKMQLAAMPLVAVGVYTVFIGAMQTAGFLYIPSILILAAGFGIATIGAFMIAVGISLRRGRRWAKVLAIPMYVLLVLIVMSAYSNMTAVYR